MPGPLIMGLLSLFLSIAIPLFERTMLNKFKRLIYLCYVNADDRLIIELSVTSKQVFEKTEPSLFPFIHFPSKPKLNISIAIADLEFVRYLINNFPGLGDWYL